MYSLKLQYRLSIIQELQSLLTKEFDYNDYNVFLFGSFLTENYVEHRNDVDFAVYSSDVSKYIDIADFILDYFKKYSIPVDIFYVDIQTIAPIYYVPLSLGIPFTIFYPIELKNFCEQCKLEYLKQYLRIRAGILGYLYPSSSQEQKS